MNMRREDNKEGVQKTQAGLPPDKQAASTEPGQTSPPPGDETLAIDLKATYLDPLDAEGKKTITGQELHDRINRGLLFDKAQSTLHKQIADLEAQVKQLSPAAQQAQELEQKLAVIAERERMDSYLDSIGLKKTQSKPARDDDADDAWPNVNEPEEKPEITRKDYLQGLEKIKKETADNARTQVQKILAEEREKTKEQDESTKRVNDFVERGMTVYTETLETEYPSVDKKTLRKIVEYEAVSGELDAAARQAAHEGDLDTAESAWLESRARQKEALRLMSDAQQAELKAQADKAHSDEVEMLSTGGPDVQALIGKTREFNPTKAREKQDERLEKAKELEKRIDALSNI